MWTNAIKHAAWLVKCDEDVPPDVVKVRCEAANTIKRQWDEIKSLQAVVKRLPHDAEGVPCLPGDQRWAWVRVHGAFEKSIHQGSVFIDPGGELLWVIGFGVLAHPAAVGIGYSTEAAARAAGEEDNG